MHYTAAVPLFSSILLLGGLVAAVPVAKVDEQCHSRIICVDSLSPCGIRYGGCYDVCDDSAKPKPPPCPTTTKKPAPTTTKKTTKKPPIPSTTNITTKVTTIITTLKPVPSPTKPTTSKKRTPTTTKKATTTTREPTPIATKDCAATAFTVCWDGINECGMMYGGCFPDCKPWPDFKPPPCPTTKPTPTVITKVTSLPTLTAGHD